MKFLYSGLIPLDCSCGDSSSAEQLGCLLTRFVLTNAVTRGVGRAVLACEGVPFRWKIRTLETEYYPHPDFQSTGLGVRVEATLVPSNGAAPQICEVMLRDPCWVAHELESKEYVRSADYVIMHDVSLIVLRQMLTVCLRKVGGEPAEPPTEEQEKLWKHASWAAAFSKPGSLPYW